MRYKPGKTAIILDLVGNYTRHGLPDEPIEWSLDRSHTKHKFHNADGSYSIRVCPECFQTFKTAPVCPYCGAEYPVQGRELKAMEEVELQRITAEEAEKAKEVRKQLRMEVGRARDIADLQRIAKERGYAPGWVWKMAQVKKLRP